jgi:hypothetical protein
MSKPIIFIRIPISPSGPPQIPTIQKTLDDYFDNEYHVLCVPTREDEFEMQVFNDPNLTEVNFEQLKEIVERELYELKYHEPEKELPEDQEGS